ncbi:MAG: M48 family metallopeptidase [Alphaproteobacteria bacterium]|nr:M48 family metallopeptidase [Alphaproteobacteria bacterium]
MIGFLRGAASLRATPPAPEPHVLRINGRDVPLRFKRNARARRMVLRLDQKAGGLVMTLPRRTGLAEALRFAEKSLAWILRQLEQQLPPVMVAEGAQLLLRGEPHKIALPPQKRGVVRVEGGVIHVPGGPEHAPRRLKDHLKKLALEELTSRSRHYALAMGSAFSGIAVRDQKSRWGSCSAAGKLSYSWRLILAPPFVLDYVAAHEVAHLKEMNHGPRFWRLVLTHCPHARSAKVWLKEHGRKIHSLL